MPSSLHLNEFIQRPGTILDVRSPSEYLQGHIPGSYSLPLFNDQERALIGTAYKQVSQEKAIDLGLQIAGPKLFDLVQLAKQFLNKSEGKIVCWRGGMRSGFLARLLESIGFTTITLKGGYKSYRRDVLKTVEGMTTSQPLIYVLGGLTGSGKTQILQHLKNDGEQTIDLEALAKHRGSTFGAIGMNQQASQEEFENQLAHVWNRLDFSKPIWIEDESRLIGKCCIPVSLYNLLNQSTVFYIDIPIEERLAHLLTIYGKASLQELIESTLKLARRLGSLKTNEIISFFNLNLRREAFTLLLSYYDKTYLHHLKRKTKVHMLEESPSLSFEGWAKFLRNETIKLQVK